MKKKASREIVRVYSRAEVAVEVNPAAAGTALERTIKLRFKTWDFASGRADIESPTPWVMMSVAMMEGLSLQLAGVVETAKRWEPGTKPDIVGPGMVEAAPFEGL